MPKRWREASITIHDPSWEERETVTLKSYYSDADRAAVLSASTEYHQDAAGQTVMRTTLDEMARVKRTRAIKSWTLEDAEGGALPLTSEVIANLPMPVAAYIDAEIDKLWEGLALKTPAQQKEATQEEVTFSGHAAHSGAGPAETADHGPTGATGAGRPAARRSRAALPDTAARLSPLPPRD